MLANGKFSVCGSWWVFFFFFFSPRLLRWIHTFLGYYNLLAANKVVSRFFFWGGGLPTQEHIYSSFCRI
jgi:hypothetical protein